MTSPRFGPERRGRRSRKHHDEVSSGFPGATPVGRFHGRGADDQPSQQRRPDDGHRRRPRSAPADELTAADGALASVNEILGRATRARHPVRERQLFGRADREAGSKEVEGLIKQAIAVSNMRVRRPLPVRRATRTTPRPSTATASTLATAGFRTVEIAPGQLQDAYVPGDVIFTGAGGGTDVFQALSALNTGLQTNDSEHSVRSSLSSLEKGIMQVTDGRARLGTAANVFDSAVSTAQIASDSEKAAVTNLGDADVFNSRQPPGPGARALDAALTASARSFQPTLLDKLS